MGISLILLMHYYTCSVNAMEFNFAESILNSGEREASEKRMKPFTEKNVIAEIDVVRINLSDSVRCLSCMSKFYEAVWPSLSSIYKKPKTFTDKCDEDASSRGGESIAHCSTICVRMWEEAVVAGIRIKGNIRGCLSDILHNGFNQSIISWYRWMHRDSCRQYRKRELFKLSVQQSDESFITVCTCYDDFCNSSSGACKFRQPTIILCLSIFILIIVQWNRW